MSHKVSDKNEVKYNFLYDYIDKCKINAVSDNDTRTAYKYLVDLARMVLFTDKKYKKYIFKYDIDVTEIAHDVATYILEKLWEGKDVKNINGYILYSIRYFLYGKAYKGKTNIDKVVRWHNFNSIIGDDIDIDDSIPNINVDPSIHGELYGSTIYPLLYISLKYNVRGELINPRISLYRKPISRIVSGDNIIKSIANYFGNDSSFALYILMEYLLFSKQLSSSQIWMLFNYPRLFMESVKLSGDDKTRLIIYKAVRKTILFYHISTGNYKKVNELLKKFGYKRSLMSILYEYDNFSKFLLDASKDLGDRFLTNMSRLVDSVARDNLIDLFDDLLKSTKKSIEEIVNRLKELDSDILEYAEMQS